MDVARGESTGSNSPERTKDLDPHASSAASEISSSTKKCLALTSRVIVLSQFRSDAARLFLIMKAGGIVAPNCTIEIASRGLQAIGPVIFLKRCNFNHLYAE
jgi:hypothetical protein